MTVTKEFTRSLPKAELHVHLDGCIRPITMLEIARENGTRLPADDPESLADAMHVKRARNLEEYLERYQFTIAVMQSPEALERIAYEFVVDAAQENIRYLEVRYCPALHTPAVTLTQAVEAPLEGIRRAEEETGTKVRLIISALRTLAPSVSDDLARLAIDYQSEGVVAFDLAGSERGHPAAQHARAFEHVLNHGLNCTCHAGEGDGPESVREALDLCHAQRIGHGTRIAEDPELEEYVIEQQIPLEICLTSNLHTHTVTDLRRHPARGYFDRGCVVTLNTDSRLMDRIDLSHEYWLAHRLLGFSREELAQISLNTFNSAFLPEDEKKELIGAVKEEIEELL